MKKRKEEDEVQDEDKKKYVMQANSVNLTCLFIVHQLKNKLLATNF